MLIVILHTLRQPCPCQLLLSKCWGPSDIRRKPPPTDTFFHKDTLRVSWRSLSWSPCRVRLRWRCSSEDRYTPILLQIWKSLHKVCVNYSVTRGLRKGYARKSESIRITLSDLDQQQVVSRSTGHFQPCFPPRRTVSSPVFPSKLKTPIHMDIHTRTPTNKNTMKVQVTSLEVIPVFFIYLLWINKAKAKDCPTRSGVYFDDFFFIIMKR